MSNFLRQAEKQILRGDTASAIRMLRGALERTDGFVLRGAIDEQGAGRDWVTDPAAQVAIYDLLIAAVEALEET